MSRRTSRRVAWGVSLALVIIIYFIFAGHDRGPDSLGQKAEPGSLGESQKEAFRGTRPQDGAVLRHDENEHDGHSPGVDGGDTRLGRRIRAAKERDTKRQAALEVAAKEAKQRTSSSEAESEREGLRDADGRLPHEVQKLPTPKSPAATDESPSPADETIKLLMDEHPMLLFSKTYCPHSARAKRILLEEYAFTPPPHIVELDKRETNPPHDGRMLQEELRKMTGRGTVPNVMVKGQSLGGGSEIQELSDSGSLIQKVEALSSGEVIGVLVKT